MTITKELLHELFDYVDGNLIWKTDRVANKVKGMVAGSFCNRYYQIFINNRSYLTHRLIFMYHNGYMPNMIDHIDGNTKNNKIENLRECTARENTQNKCVSSRSKTGIKNVYKTKNNKWKVEVNVNGKQKYFGTYEDLELAELVAIEARNKYHKLFARHK